MKQPLVSVLMPCYNAENHLEDAMNSILDQTYNNLEIIAIDDCSKDKTSEILHKMAKSDNRIKVVDNEENLRLINTLNLGIAFCNGEYIARMDSDDIALPQRIEKEVAFLEQHKDYDIVSSLFLAFRSDNPSKKKFASQSSFTRGAKSIYAFQIWNMSSSSDDQKKSFY